MALYSVFSGFVRKIKSWTKCLSRYKWIQITYIANRQLRLRSCSWASSHSMQYCTCYEEGTWKLHVQIICRARNIRGCCHTAPVTDLYYWEDHTFAFKTKSNSKMWFQRVLVFLLVPNWITEHRYNIWFLTLSQPPGLYQGNHADRHLSNEFGTITIMTALHIMISWLLSVKSVTCTFSLWNNQSEENISSTQKSKPQCW